MPAPSSFRSGISREEALRTYAESVNGENTLFAYLPHLPEKLEQMRTLLHDPITADEAHAMDDVLYRRRRYADMIAWLSGGPVCWAAAPRAEEKPLRRFSIFDEHGDLVAIGTEDENPDPRLANLWRNHLQPLTDQEQAEIEPPTQNVRGL